MMLSNSPIWFRKFLVDFLETSLAFLLAFNFVFPGTVAQAEQVGLSLFAGIAGALVSALRRAAPSIIDWMKSKLGVS